MSLFTCVRETLKRTLISLERQLIKEAGGWGKTNFHDKYIYKACTCGKDEGLCEYSLIFER